MPIEMVKTHLIVTDQYDEYGMNWVGRLIDIKPKIDRQGMLEFAFVSSCGRMEVKTSFDMKYITKLAQKFTYPRGRQSVTTDKCWVYIKTEDGGETLIAVAKHDHIKKYAPMFDPVEV